MSCASVRTTTCRTGGCRSSTTWLGTRIGRAAGLHRNSTANRARNTDDFRLLNLTWHTTGLGHHASLTNLTAGRVRNLASADFLSHRAGRVRNLLGDRLTGPRAGRVRNLFRDRLAGPRTGCVRNLLGDRLTGPRAGRVRNLFRDALLLVADAGVWDLLDAGDGNTTADRVRLLAVTNFLHHACAADRSHLGAGHPAFATDCASRLAAARARCRAAIGDGA